MDDRQTGWRSFSAWRSSGRQRQARLGFPMGQKAGALQFKTEPFAQRRAGKTVNGTGGILAIQDEGVGQQPLDGARIDIGLVRHIAAVAQTAPISHQQMRILVFHGPVHPLARPVLPIRNGTVAMAGNRAEAVPSAGNRMFSSGRPPAGSAGFAPVTGP